MHRHRLGPRPEPPDVKVADLSPALLEKARATWRERARAEFRNMQILTRFLGEAAGAGDPLDVYAGITALIDEKITATERCAAMCEALGAPALLPAPVVLQDSPRFLGSPMAERALATAINLLAVNETVAAGYLADQAARCRNTTIKAALTGPEHREFGWTYIREALRRFSPSTSPDWRHLVAITLEPHEKTAARTLQGLPADRQTLSAWPEPELADLGLLSHERQALVYHQLWSGVLKPRLAELELLPASSRPG
jgi:hypothetical protein